MILTNTERIVFDEMCSKLFDMIHKKIIKSIIIIQKQIIVSTMTFEKSIKIEFI